MIPLGTLASARHASGPLGLPVTDAFTRSDSSSLGNAATGHPWVPAPSDAAGISTNRLAWNNYTPTGGYRFGQATVETGASDVTVTATFGTGIIGTYEQLIARWVDSNNFYRLQHQNAATTGFEIGRAYLIRMSSGTETVIDTGTWCPATIGVHPHSLTVREESGSTRIIVHCNGVEKYNALDSSGGRPMGTRHGVIIQTETSISWPPGVYVDDFSVTTPAY